jgi:signal transduction histidine kinase
METRKRRVLDGKGIRTRLWIAVPVLTALITALATYFLARAYVLRQAEANIRDVLLSHRGFHLYIQRVMLPEYYAAMKAGKISEDYYAPALLSSSYIVRMMHGFFNEERVKDGLPPVYYKMAANNPRNPVNKADARESGYIRLFNERRDLHEIRETLDLDGKPYLMRVIPFLPNDEACLRCHSQREKAPAGLQALYPGQGGFNEKLGEIRAVEVVRVPIAHEIQTAALGAAAVAGGLLGLTLLAMFNGRLRGLVRARTALLEHEIHERRHAEAEVRELNRNLEQRVEERSAQLLAVNKELDAFAYSVSHDLRAPLRAIDGFSQALEEDCADRLDEDGKNYLQRVRKGCTRMGRLIEDLLQLSRLSRRDIVRTDLDLSAMAGDVVEELRAGASTRSVEFQIEPNIKASGDATLLRAVLDNLLGNAFKFTSTTPEARIEFGQTETNGRTIYFIRDNGVGFDMQYVDKLFGAFQRLHAAGEFEGTGIGLATVQRIILRHGGQIWPESQLGKGASFFFTLQEP